MRIGPIQFVNAKEMSEKYPDTFHWEDLSSSMAIGDYVKVSSGTERFWVKITGMEQNADGAMEYVGLISNLLLNPHIDIDEPVRFSAVNVYNKD